MSWASTDALSTESFLASSIAAVAVALGLQMFPLVWAKLGGAGLRFDVGFLRRAKQNATSVGAPMKNGSSQESWSAVQFRKTFVVPRWHKVLACSAARSLARSPQQQR